MIIWANSSPLRGSGIRDSTPRDRIALHAPPSVARAAPHATASRAAEIPPRSALAATSPHRVINRQHAFAQDPSGASPTVLLARVVPDRGAPPRIHHWYRASPRDAAAPWTTAASGTATSRSLHADRAPRAHAVDAVAPTLSVRRSRSP